MAMPVIHRDITPYDKSAHLLACPPAKKVFWTKFGQTSPLQSAVNNILHKIGPEIIGMDCRRQRDIDYAMIELDGTPNKGKLGANAMLAVSLATAKVAAEISGLPLYRYLGGVNAKDLPVLNGQYLKRRPARRQQRGYPGIYDHTGRRCQIFRRNPHVRGSFPLPEIGFKS